MTASMEIDRGMSEILKEVARGEASSAEKFKVNSHNKPEPVAAARPPAPSLAATLIANGDFRRGDIVYAAIFGRHLFVLHAEEGAVMALVCNERGELDGLSAPVLIPVGRCRLVGSAV